MKGTDQTKELIQIMQKDVHHAIFTYGMKEQNVLVVIFL